MKRSVPHPRRIPFAVASALALAWGGPARADDPSQTAEHLFQEARALVKEGRYAVACPKLEQSAKLEPAVGTQFNLADCWEHVGRTATAYTLFNQVASIARAAGKFERERSAKDRAAALEPILARLHLVVAEAAPGLEVKLDDAPVEPSRWAAAFPVDPGPHRIHASAPGRTAWDSAVIEEPGKTVELTIPELVDPSPKPKAVAEPPASPPPDTTSSSTQKTIALVIGGVAIVALGIGIGAGAVALSDRSNGERLCPSNTFHFHCPTTEGASDWSSAHSAGNVSTILFVSAGVAAAAATVLWVTAPKAPVRVGVSPGGIRLEGSL